MKYNELVQAYFERSNALFGFWTIYVIVIGGIFGKVSRIGFENIPKDHSACIRSAVDERATIERVFVVVRHAPFDARYPTGFAYLVWPITSGTAL